MRYANPVGVVHLVHGCAGNKEKHSTLQHVKPYSAYRNDRDFGFATLTANATSMTWESRRAADGAVDDRVQITKDPQRTPAIA